MKHLLVLTVVASDRTGIIEQLSNCIASHNGNWTQSGLSRLAGKFAGVILVEVDAGNRAALESDLANLSQQGIKVSVDESVEENAELATVELSLVANDRPGIVGEITRILAKEGVSVESFDSWCEAAPMSSDMLFHGYANLVLPEHLSQEGLLKLLENLSDDMFVEIPEPEDD